MNLIQTLQKEEVARVTVGKKIPHLSPSVTVRKISFGEGVERVFPLFSPSVDSVEVVRQGKVRRAKLYYLRERRGKSARIVERKGGARGEGYEGEAAPAPEAAAE